MLIPCQLPNKPRYWTQTDADCGALPGFISRIRNKLYFPEFNLMVLLSMSTARRSMLEVSTHRVFGLLAGCYTHNQSLDIYLLSVSLSLLHSNAILEML